MFEIVSHIIDKNRVVYNHIDLRVKKGPYNSLARTQSVVSTNRYPSCHSRSRPLASSGGRLLTKKRRAGTFRHWGELERWLLWQCHNGSMVLWCSYVMLKFHKITKCYYIVLYFIVAIVYFLKLHIILNYIKLN